MAPLSGGTIGAAPRNPRLLLPLVLVLLLLLLPLLLLLALVLALPFRLLPLDAEEHVTSRSEAAHSS